MENLVYESIEYLLLYFPKDSTFSVSSINETDWSQDIYRAMLIDSAGKVLVPAECHGRSCIAIIVQCSACRDSLISTTAFANQLKNIKNWPIEQILGKVARFCPEVIFSLVRNI